MRLIFFLFLTVVVSRIGYSQYTVIGNAIDEGGAPLAFANAVVYRAVDSSFVSGTTTDL